MQWTDEADAAIKRVPFFVRKRVRARVEKEAAAKGKTGVDLADVKATQARYLNTMSREVKGYQVDACFGGSGCPHRVLAGDELVGRIETLMAEANLLEFLRSQVSGDLKFHHEFRISIAECPNACSQPQIKDVGILGATTPAVTDIACNACGACQDTCKEDAVRMTADETIDAIDPDRCVHCGACVAVCPTGTVAIRQTGYRVMIGGKLGRHPRLARELPGIHAAHTVIDMLADFVRFYKRHSRNGQRFSQLLSEADIDAFANKWSS